MPRILSASVDDTSCYTVTQNNVYGFNVRPSHTASATDLRYLAKLEHVLAEARKHEDFQPNLHASPSTPRPYISYDARRSASNPDTNGVLDSVSSPGTSSSNECHVPEPSTGAYPLSPAFQSAGYASSDRESVLSHDADPFPFPLNPSPISAHSFPTVTNPMALSRTPSRRWPIGRHCWTPPSSPDRYISNRQKPQDASKTFRVSKSPHKLSSSEKLLRHPSATPDPFGPLVVPRTRDHRSAVPVSGDGQLQRSRPQTMGFTNLLTLPQDTLVLQDRQVSAGAVWNVGGSNAATHSGPIRSISDGRGGFLSSGSNAPMYTSHFYDEDILDHGLERMESRLAAALDIDLTSRVIDTSRAVRPTRSVSVNVIGVKRKSVHCEPRIRWKHGEWTQGACQSLLDAPSLRDDYYCTILAYCRTSHVLAVGLGNRVYLWSESGGVQYPPELNTGRMTHVTSVSFSSTEGGHSILAIGRNSGQISLWSLHDAENIRFLRKLPRAVACVAFKPVVTRRHSEHFNCMMATEELLVGDEIGTVYYYSVEWMSKEQFEIHQYEGSMTLLAKITVHNQQICGIAWSIDGEFFATGANDNACCLFETKDIFAPRDPIEDALSTYRSPFQTLLGGLALPKFIARINSHSDSMEVTASSTHVSESSTVASRNNSLLIVNGAQKHKWMHSAAIKAIAFCPWQRGLIATGGGSNDRAIHFYHVYSGACLATINVYTQVTSLIWSTTRREIVATFGYAQPDHPYRIAVFSWPDCKQVVAIPWASDMRALYAIPYPGGSGETTANTSMGETWFSRTKEEGCIVVACSDESVKFHEVWSGASKSTDTHMGLLGGSDILEGLEGIDKEGTKVIR